jgi:hypothetical protein
LTKLIWLFPLLALLVLVAAGSFALFLSLTEAGSPRRANLVGEVPDQSGCDIRLTIETDLETKEKVVTDKGKVFADYSDEDDVSGTVEWVGCPQEAITGQAGPGRHEGRLRPKRSERARYIPEHGRLRYRCHARS